MVIMHTTRVLLVLLIWSVRSESIRPSDHGLAYEKSLGAVPPAMAAFFRGQPEAELPEALNTTEPAWSARFSPPDQTSTRIGRRRAVVFFATGVACGLVGVGLLATAAVFYFAHNRRADPMDRPGTSLGLVRWKKSPEVRLGS